MDNNEFIFSNNNIKKLDLNNKGLSSIPTGIGKLHDLEELFLRGNQLTKFSNEIEELGNLLVLDITDNQFATLPLEICRLRNLRELYLRYNRLITLPPEIGGLSKLNKLQLGGNKLRNLPSDIRLLQNLHSLHMSNNNFTNIPTEIGFLINLEELLISFNNISEIPEIIGKLVNLKKLYLSNNQIKDFPIHFCQLIKLEELNIHNNQLSNVPIEIDKLINLKKLVLTSNNLKLLPSEIGQLNNLEELQIGDNQLAQLPKEIGQLTNLLDLHLKNNLLSSIPHEIGLLSKLNILDLSHNFVKLLPQEIGGLIHLTDLDLSHNQLIELPAEIGQLAKISRLYLNNNKIGRLPIEICRLKNLKILDLRNNPLQIPPEILEQPNKPYEIITYYLRHFQDTAEKRPLNEAKMLIVGQPEVGKSSLKTRLMEDDFNAGQPSTKGIDIKKWKIEIDETVIQLNIWDFGGQEIMHATHQFFFTRRSLYVLVLDSRQGERENFVEYWLKLIHSFGNDSPVIIVCNKTDECELDLDWALLQKKYPNIKSFMKRVSCKTGEGIIGLRTEIAREVANLAHIRDELLSSWFAVKNKLVKMVERNIDYISYKQYEDICSQENINDKLDQQTLLGFLHDLGIVLHFRDHPILEDTNVLNPEWVTRGVYLILTSHKLFQERGILNREDLDLILDPATYPRNKHMFIIDMMRKFELCFDFEGYANKRFLVPDLLPKEEPYTGEWEDSIAFQYHYDVLPSSVISRFIVRMHSYIFRNTYWRQGVVLGSQDPRNKALVKADLEDKKIFIYVAGRPSGRRIFLEIIRADFNKIHKTIPRLKVKEKIPISGNPNVVVDYQHLRNLEEIGEETFIPEGLRERVYIKDLLNGIESENQRINRDMHEYQQSKDFVMRDKIIISGPGVVVTGGSQAYDMQLQQIWNQVQPQIDMETLWEDLEKLKRHLKKEAKTTEQLQAVTDVALAQEEVKAGNGPKILGYLKNGGVWALKKADEIGTKVAVEVIKKSMGL